MTDLDAILNKIEAVAVESAPDGETALALLQAIYKNKLAPLSVRMRAATIAIQYESPKLAVTGYLRDDAGFAAALERAIERSGKRDEMKVIEHRDDGTN
jgi:hypothetical protein